MATPLEQALHNLAYHKVRDERQERMEVVRETLKDAAIRIDAMCEGIDMPRELQMAYRSLEDACMYAIAGIARHGDPGPEHPDWR